MSGYLYFLNNLKDRKDHIPYIGLYNKLQNHFRITSSSFQEEHQLVTTLLFFFLTVVFCL